MSTIQDILRSYGNEYISRFATRMPNEHRKVIHAIQRCRTSQSGTIIYLCPDCNTRHIIAASCGNRHCPMCQQAKAQDWLQKQYEKLLPCDYFFLTVTVPQELRRVIRSNQRLCYDALFKTARYAIQKLASDPRFVGTNRIGMMTTLHTWGSQLQYHPHLHIIVPAGGTCRDGVSWMPSQQNCLVHTKPLASIIRGAFRDAMLEAGLQEKIPPDVWNKQWVVHSQHAGNGTHALRYLARYVNRVAISNNRIKFVDDVKRTVTFSYKNKHHNRWRTMTVDVMEFIRRFLQHVLPHGFMKIRHYGFLNSNCSQSIVKIRLLIYLHEEKPIELLSTCEELPIRRPLCAHCGHRLRFITFISPTQRRNTG